MDPRTDSTTPRNRGPGTLRIVTGLLRDLLSPRTPRTPQLIKLTPSQSDTNNYPINKEELMLIGSLVEKKFSEYARENNIRRKFFNISKQEFPHFKVHLAMEGNRVVAFVKLKTRYREMGVGAINIVNPNYLQISYSTDHSPIISHSVVQRKPKISEAYALNPSDFIRNFDSEDQIHRKLSKQAGICHLIVTARYTGSYGKEGLKQPIEKYVQYLEYHPKGDLQVYCSRIIFPRPPTNRMPLDERIETSYSVAESMLQGIYSCHQKGITHFDIKMENLLITRESPLEVKVTDFGHATDKPDANSVGGTPVYFSPELVRSIFSQDSIINEQTAPSSDVWAGGVVLYYFIFGEFPAPCLLIELLTSLCFLEQSLEIKPTQRKRSNGPDSDAAKPLQHSDSGPFIGESTSPPPMTPAAASAKRISLLMDTAPFGSPTELLLSPPTSQRSEQGQQIIGENLPPIPESPRGQPQQQEQAEEATNFPLRRTGKGFDFIYGSHTSITSAVSVDTDILLKDLDLLMTQLKVIKTMLKNMYRNELGDIFKYLSPLYQIHTHLKPFKDITNILDALITSPHTPRRGIYGLVPTIIKTLQTHNSGTAHLIEEKQVELKKVFKEVQTEAYTLLYDMYKKMENTPVPKDANRIIQLVSQMLQPNIEKRLSSATALGKIKEINELRKLAKLLAEKKAAITKEEEQPRTPRTPTLDSIKEE